MVPSAPTSTISVSGAPVCGSYSTGGHTTLPSVSRIPSTRWSRNPVRNAPMTGPVVRWKS